MIGSSWERERQSPVSARIEPLENGVVIREMLEIGAKKGFAVGGLF